LFTYNRLEHTLRILNALKANPEACETKLYVFSDEAKNERDIESVLQVRNLLDQVQGFKTVEVKKRTRHKGLYFNIRQGLDELFQNHPRLIILEDDLIPTRNFLAFMNAALNRYGKHSRIGSITGFCYPTEKTPHSTYDAFFFHRFCCWGWAMWQDRWKAFSWNLPKREHFLQEKEPFMSLSSIANDLPEILLDRLDHKNHSWGIHLCLDHCIKNLFFVYPTVSKIQNNGFDGTGTHCLVQKDLQVVQDLTDKREFRLPFVEEKACQQLCYQYFQNSWGRKSKN
jgi:hypothetical protein